MFLNREVLAQGHNANIQTFWEKMITHTFLYAKQWTDNQATFTQTQILCMDEKGVQVMTETGTMSAKRQYSDRLRLFVVYRGIERGILYFG